MLGVGALVAAVLAAIPSHAILLRGPVVTQAAPDGALVTWRTDVPTGATLRVDGRRLPGGITKDPSIRVTGLVPGRRYRYRLAAGQETLAAGSFRTAPPPDEGFRAAVFGDYGAGSEAERRVARLAASWRPDLLVTTGDNAYPLALASLLDTQIFLPLRRLLAVTAWAPALGNHDYYLTNARDFLAAVHLPGAGRWYVQRFGPVAFVVLDSDREMGPGTPQGRFLRAAARATQDACFRIAVFHHRPFSPNAAGIAEGLQQDLVPVLRSGRFQLALMGHVHWYERSLPRDGTTYVIVGTGGAAPDQEGDDSLPRAAQVKATFGALRLDVAPGRLAGTFVDVDGNVRDRFALRCTP